MNNFEKLLGFNLKAFEKRIYALCDYETLLKKNISLDEFIDICKKLNVTLIQYRDKISSLEQQKENLIFLKDSISVPIIINDKLELLQFAHGIHFGQEDLKILKNEKFKVKSEKLVFKFLRKKYPHKVFGLSTHNELEILKANELDIDMIGLGAYRATLTKDVKNILGDNISYLAKISKHPVCVIGGVKKDDNIKNCAFHVIGSALYES